jgi:hypothetical protein
LFLFSGKTPTKVDANPPTISKDEYDRAEQEIFNAIGRLEENVERVVEREVDTLFHELEHHEKTAIKVKAKEAVKRGAKKVKQNVDDHDHSKQQTLPTLHHLHHYPYDWPHQDPEHRILHAIEAAEKAVLHAVNSELKIIFRELEHHDDAHAAKQAQKILKHGVAKANKHLDDSHEQRRNWLTDDTNGEERKIEEYMKYGWAIQ